MIDKIKINFVFQEYPVVYQPYIPPIVDAIRNKDTVILKINIFKGITKGYIIKLPSYNFRRVYETIYQFVKRASVKLNYLEIQSLKQKIDVLHIQDSFLHRKIFGLLEIEAYKRPKIVITLRGSDTYVKPYIYDKWLVFYEKYAHKVDAFVVMSQHQKQYLHRNLLIDANKIHVIPISFGPINLVQAKLPDPNSIKIASAFRMCWEKNIEGNLRVIKYLKEQGLSVQYDLYGDGPDVGQVFYLINKYKLNDCVRYHGRLNNIELKTQLKRSDFYLQLSHSESLGMSVIEAQSLGLPAIVSNSDGLPEAILPNESGYCVNAYNVQQASDYIISLWNDRDLYEKFSKKGIDFVNSHFTIEKEASSLMDLYCKLTE